MKSFRAVLSLVPLMLLLAACGVGPQPVGPSESAPESAQAEPSAEWPPSNSEVVLRGSYTAIESQETRSDFYYPIWLECGDRLLIIRGSSSRLPSENPLNCVEAIDAATGKSLYHHDLDPALGELLRVAKSDLEAGYDYCLYFDRVFIYKDSADWSRELRVALPEHVQVEKYDVGLDHAGYDVSADAIVWTAEDGIWLCDRDGGGARQLLFNEHISEGSKESFGADTGYVQPRFALGGSMVIAGLGVFGGDGNYLLYPMMVDLATGRQTTSLKTPMPDWVVYPVADRYLQVYSSGYGMLRVLDVTDHTERHFYEFGAKWSPDGDAVLWYEVDEYRYHKHPITVYLSDLDCPMDSGVAVLEEDGGWLETVTEHYLIFTLDDEQLWLKRYRQ